MVVLGAEEVGRVVACASRYADRVAKLRRSHRVHLADERGNDQVLRVTWHRDHGQFVVSQWRHGVCIGATRIGATRIGVAEARELLAVLAEGITDAATAGPAEAAVSAVGAPAGGFDRPEQEA